MTFESQRSIGALAAVALTACAPTRTALQPDAVPAIAATYQRSGTVTLTDRSESLVVTADHEPVLVAARVCGEYADLPGSWACYDERSAPLGDVSATEDHIVFGRWRAPRDQVRHASLETSTRPERIAERIDTPDDLRHRVGVQVGGSGVFQISYRYRIVGPLLVDVGGFGAPHAINTSAGALASVPLAARWSFVLASGGAFMAAFGQRPVEGCDPNAGECEYVDASLSRAFVYARAGLAVRPGQTQRDIIGFDLGIWYGTAREDADGQTISEARFLWPMAGLSYHWAL